MKYYATECFWCHMPFQQRCDVIKRQMAKYGHSCCKRCFGKEKTFSDAQKARTDNRSHPHSKETKILLSKLKIGKSSWNKGLTSETDERVRLNAIGTKNTRATKDYTGSKNSNWKGGSSLRRRIMVSEEKIGWKKFREYILSEDGYGCVKCNNKFPSNLLEVHHLASAKRYPELIFDRTNCWILCKKCHKRFHSEFGISRFTPNDFLNFINRDRERSNYLKLC